MPEELDPRPDLRGHRPLAELPRREVPLELVARRRLEPPLPRFVEADGDPGDVGHDRERVGPDLPRHEGRGPVLVDHGIDAVEPPAPATDDRDPASARHDGHPGPPGPDVEETADERSLEPPERGRRRHEASPAAPGGVVGEHPPGPLAKETRLRLRIVPPDRLRRPPERRVAAIDLDAAEDRRDRDRRSKSRERRPELLQDEVADLPFRLRPQDEQRGRRNLAFRQFRGAQQRPHLGAVAVRHHELVALGHELRERARRRPHLADRLRPRPVAPGPVESVAAERYDDPGHNGSRPTDAPSSL